MRKIYFIVALATISISALCNRLTDPVAYGETSESVSTPDTLQITEADVEKDIVGHVVQVGNLKEPVRHAAWTFEPDDPLHVRILDTALREDESTVDALVATDNNPRPGEIDVHLAGTLRLHYERSGDGWNLREIENLSFRYSIQSRS